MRKLVLTLATVTVLGTSLTACGSGRHCELDATDETVADSFCESNTPGYEWEDDKSKSKKKKRR